MKMSSTLKHILVAVGGSLVAVPAAALELGEVRVHSTLGQPLRVSIAYALSPQETISETCVSLQANMAANGLPSVSRASMIITDGVIAITGRSIVREPIVTIQVNVRCPYMAQLNSEYMMFIDPAGTTAELIAAATAARTVSQPQVSAPIATQIPATARRRQVINKPITDATRYQVEVGDTLSEIAQRIENRPVGLWDAVNSIFQANPDAFLDNDPNKLKAGSWLSIPSFGTSEPVSVVDELSPATSPVEPASDDAAYEFEADVIANEPNSALVDRKPGERIPDSENPFITPIDSIFDESVLIPDTLLDIPASTSDSPKVPLAIIQPDALAEPATTNWMLWFVGSGLAIVAALLLFGRKFRIGSSPITPAEPQHRQTDSEMQKVDAIGDVDTDIVDDLPTVEIPALDVDLPIGTELQEGTEVDDAQDLSFAVATDLDFELPEEMPIVVDSSETDIIPPLCVEDSSILQSEVLPSEVDDYEVLEQDYEDELTASQALKVEMQKAAEELAARLDEDVADVSIESPLATVHELDTAAQTHATDDQEISKEDDTGISPAMNMETGEETVEAPANSSMKTQKSRFKAG